MMKYLSIITLITMPLFSADKANAINKLMFDGMPPFCANHIAEADATELDIDAESFKNLHTHALASIKVRADDLQSRLQALSLDDSGTLAQEKELMTYACNITFSTHTFIASLAKKYETNPAKVSTQDILRCAQWAKWLENDDSYITLTFHHGVAWNTSARVLARNSIGGILAEHEWIERSKYGSDEAQYATPGVDSGEVKDANLDFFDNVTYETFEKKKPNPHETPQVVLPQGSGDEFEFFSVEPQKTVTSTRRPWGRGIELNPKLVQEILNKGDQKGFTTLPLETEGPTKSWASITTKTSAAEQTTPTGHPFVWGEGKLPSQKTIDKFDAKAEKGPQNGVTSMQIEPTNQQ